VRHEDAVSLIRSSVEGLKGSWADLGSGRGTFTRALHDVLGADSRIVAVDVDARAVEEVQAWARTEAPNVSALQADFTQPIDLSALDGFVLANALHFVKDQAPALARLVKMLRPGGRVVLIEYDKRPADRWCPYPVGIAALPQLAKSVGLGRFTVAESRPSNYSGVIYAAHADAPS
jgi:trans-aconitate methyltransferase